jgi:hypothetical protein
MPYLLQSFYLLGHEIVVILVRKKDRLLVLDFTETAKSVYSR